MKNLTSPEALLILPVAVTFDLIGFVIFCLGTWFGVDDYGILEMMGIAVFGLWLFMRHGPLGGDAWKEVKEKRENIQEEMTGSKEMGPKAPIVPKGGKERSWRSPQDINQDPVKKIFKKTLKRFGLTFLIELIPFLGGFYPGWTILVYKELD